MQTLTKTLTGAQIVINTLKSLGIDNIFGYPGSVVLDVYDELSKQTDIKHYLMRHEQAACHAAEGYFRASGKCSAVLVTSGPGATNIITGLANAYLDGFPLIAITGQVSEELLYKDSFQEVDIISMTKCCTKKNFQVTDINNLQSTIIEAYKIAMSDKKGPVLIDITKNVFSENSSEYENIFIQKINKNENLPPQSDIAADLIQNALRPVIISGGGATYREVKELSHMLNIPVVKTMMGFYPENDTNFRGMIGIFGEKSANKIIEESDLVFAIGTRLNERINCCFDKTSISKKLIHLDINKNEISKKIPAYIGLCGDSETVLNYIISKLKPSNNTIWLEYTKTLSKLNKQPEKRSNRLHSFEVLSEIQNFTKDMSPIVTTEVGQHQVWASRYLIFNEPNKFITSGGLGTMGFGFPAAIGASISNNKAPVICIAGDGSIQMNIQELATCMEYNIPIKIFILNNGYLGMVRQLQEKICDERYFATKISNPNFVKIAESYGITGIRVEKFEDIKPALEKAFSINKPVIVDFVVEAMEIL